MAFNIPNYLMSLSDNDGEKLEEIISNYYEEFLSTYWIIKKYNTEVDTSKYKKTDTSLSLSYTFNKGFKVKPILKEIERKVETSILDISISSRGQTLTIDITK